MDNLTKLKAIKRWQQDKKLKKFKCQYDENHGKLKPFIKGSEILLKCQVCNKTFKCLSEEVYEYGHLLLLQDKKNRRN